MADSLFPDITPACRRQLAELWTILNGEARGAYRAIPTWRLAGRLGTTEREVRQLKRELVIRYRRPIGSSTGRHPGLYVITDAEERRAAIRQLDNRLRETYLLRRALDKNTTPERVAQQVFGFAGREWEPQMNADGRG